MTSAEAESAASQVPSSLSGIQTTWVNLHRRSIATKSLPVTMIVPFAPRAGLMSCCNLLALKAREGGIDLVVNAPQDLPGMTGDPRAFKQIVLNLVSNAIKFTERGGKVVVSADVEGTRMVVRIADTGVGIAAEDLKRIGHPFFQAGTTYQRRHEGTGLGLSIVKSLVELHSGELTVQSKVDEGTTVTVALQQLEAQAGASLITCVYRKLRFGSIDDEGLPAAVVMQ